VTEAGPSGHDPGLGRELLYRGERTVVRRVRRVDGDGTLVHKQALGADAAVRTRHEANILRRLDRVPGVPRLVPIDHTETLALTDTGGCTLADLMGPDRLPLSTVPQLALHLARILDQVHAAGVLHKDLHPYNVLVDPDTLDVTLIDFDLSTTFSEVRPGFTHHDQILGRLPYLAPEQTGRTGLPVDERADLYGFGALLFEMVAGRLPIEEDDPLRLLRDILGRVPESLSQLVPATPPVLSAIVARLLEKEPDRRYQSAGGLVHDLTRLCADPHRMFPLGERDFPRRLSPPSQLIGRNAEICTLATALDGVSDQPRCVLVRGLSGVGKSALVARLRPMVTDRNGWYVTGKADQYRQTHGADVVLKTLTELCQLLLAEPPQVLSVTVDRLRSALGTDAAVLAEVLPPLAQLLGENPDAADHVDSTGQQQAGETDVMDREIRLRRGCVALLRTVASPERPIAMVLDDLQWAGTTVLNVIDALLADEDLHGLLVVGCYRAEEVDETHPLAAMSARWSRLPNPPTGISLDNLVPTELTDLLVHMLRLDHADAAALGAVIGEHSQGNPYDTVELVNALRRVGMLRLGEDGWHWDIEAIRRFSAAGDVQGFLRSQLDSLPPDTRRIVRILSCLGEDTSLDLLQEATGNTLDDLQRLLLPALEERLLVADGVAVSADQCSASRVRFRHDRVQQAAHESLGLEDRLHLQLDLARRFLDLPGREPEAADQYRTVVDLLDDPGERRRVAEVFSVAADLAQRASSHLAAESYLRSAADQWRILGIGPDDPALVELETRWHAALFRLGRMGDLDELYLSIRRRARDPLDLVDATCVQVNSHTHRGCFPQALDTGMTLLRQLGIDPPGEDLDAELPRRLDGLVAWSLDLSAARDAARPVIRDPRLVAATRVMHRMSDPAYFSSPQLCCWLTLESQRLWMDHGPSAELLPVLAHASVDLITFREDYAAGGRILPYLMEVGRLLGFDQILGKVQFLHAVSASPWTEPTPVSIEHARAARDKLLRSGIPQDAVYTNFPAVTQLLDIAPLTEGASEIDAAIALCTRTGNDMALPAFVGMRQFVRAVRGETQAPGSFGDADVDEGELQRHCREENPISGVYVFVYRAIAAALYDDDDALFAAAEDAVLGLTIQPGLNIILVGTAVRAAALARKLGLVPAHERAAVHAELDGPRQWIAQRAAEGTTSAVVLSRWVEAEYASSRGRYEDAARLFDTGMREARHQQRHWLLALFAQRAGTLHLQMGLGWAGRELLAEACALYRSWGAPGPARALEQGYPDLPDRRSPRPAPGSYSMATQSSTSSVTDDRIDMLAILRATQALGAQTDLDRLREALTEQVRNMTGATHVQLVLNEPDLDIWFLQPDSDRVTAPVRIDDPAAERLAPLSAFHYTVRTQEQLLVSDALRDDRFARDPYLAQLSCCSLLAVPIVNAGGLRAVLLLQNQDRGGNFGSRRLDAVTLIAGQLAISLDNALLYRSLADKVASRTRDLESATEILETLSVTDPLTQVANRRKFEEILRGQWQDAGGAGRSMAVIMVDIDRFKQFNDTFGHQAGDRCIREVAAALTGQARRGDHVCRYGGEEFAVVLPNTTSDEAAVVAERLRLGVRAQGIDHPGGDSVTISVGVAAVIPDGAADPDSLVAAADAALYEAKRAGRDRVVVATAVEGGR
jgi:diguanylate cyclase (GGDEF)-like protein